MVKSRRRVPVSISVVLAVIVALGTAAPVAAAGSNSGTSNCLSGHTVKVWTRSSVEVWHHWNDGWFSYWPNVPDNALRESYTGLQSTWWSSSWSTTSIGSGATCIQGASPSA